MRSSHSDTFCGQGIEPDQTREIASIVATFPTLTRNELANAICERLAWKRPTGELKTVECRQFLERLEANGIIQMPACDTQTCKKNKADAVTSRCTGRQPLLSVLASDLSPLAPHHVRAHSQRQIWYEYMDRCHQEESERHPD